MIKTVIVDDEEYCLKALRTLIEKFCPELRIEGEAESIEEAYDIILHKKPDLVMLDIQMPEGDGFELLNKFSVLPFELIFTTAHQEYAIKAIRMAAVDYLLKPISVSDLQQAVEKVEKKLLKNQVRSMGVKGKIMLASERSYLFISPGDILRIEAAGGRLTFILKDKKNIELTKNLSEYEDILNDFGFFRSHRTHLINLQEIKEYIPDKNGGCVVMTDGKMVPIALRRKDEFLLQLSRF